MKNLILPLALVFCLSGFGQADTIQEVEIVKETKVESLDVVVTVDSLEELESTFKIDDIKEMFDLTDRDESISFKIVCNGERMSNGKKSHVSYKVEGSSENQDTFIKRVKAIRKAAVNYYKNKQ